MPQVEDSGPEAAEGPGRVSWGPEERVTCPVGEGGGAGDLTSRVDSEGKAERSAQRTEILHAAAGRPPIGVALAGRRVGAADHLTAVVDPRSDSTRDADGALPAERAQVLDAPSGRPPEGTGLVVCGQGVSGHLA